MLIKMRQGGVIVSAKPERVDFLLQAGWVKVGDDGEPLSEAKEPKAPKVSKAPKKGESPIEPDQVEAPEEPEEPEKEGE